MECYIGCMCWVTSSLPANKSRMNSRLLTKRLHSRILQEALCDPPFLLPRPLAPVVPWLLCMFRFELLAFPPQLPASQAVLVPRPWAPQSWAQLARLSAHPPQTWQQINLMNVTFEADLDPGFGSAGAAGAKSSSGPKPMLDFPPGGANTLLLLFAQGSSPEYITVELAAIASLSSCFKFGAGGGAGTKRLPRWVPAQRLPYRSGPIKVRPTWLLLVLPVLTTV